MNEIYLSKTQARDLAQDLLEYAAMKDSHDRELFTGFRIRFGDMLKSEVCDDQTLELWLIADYKEIEGSKVRDDGACMWPTI